VNRLLISTLFFALAACVAFLAVREHPLRADVGTHELVAEGGARSYRLLLPHDSTTPKPVVFAFHGIGETPESMAAYSRLDRLAADNGFVLVYPAAQNSMWTAKLVRVHDA
jgi:poly(3-hydroxybutyrate) depolymerase